MPARGPSRPGSRLLCRRASTSPWASTLCPRLTGPWRPATPPVPTTAHVSELVWRPVTGAEPHPERGTVQGWTVPLRRGTLLPSFRPTVLSVSLGKSSFCLWLFLLGRRCGRWAPLPLRGPGGAGASSAGHGRAVPALRPQLLPGLQAAALGPVAQPPAFRSGRALWHFPLRLHPTPSQHTPFAMVRLHLFNSVF